MQAGVASLVSNLSSVIYNPAQSAVLSRRDQTSVLRICWSSRNLFQRVLFLAILLAAELCLLYLWADAHSVAARTGLIGAIRELGGVVS